MLTLQIKSKLKQSEEKCSTPVEQIVTLKTAIQRHTGQKNMFTTKLQKMPNNHAINQ